MKRANHVEQYQQSDTEELDQHIPLSHFPFNKKSGYIRLFTPDERFQTRTGAVVFAYKRVSAKQYLFYAYPQDA